MSLLIEIADRLKLTPREAREARTAERQWSGKLKQLEQRYFRLTAEAYDLSDRLAVVRDRDDFTGWGRGGWAYPGGGPTDRQGGRNWPVLVTETDLRDYRYLSRVLCDTNIIAIGFLGRLVEFGVGEGYTWSVALKGAKPGPVTTGGQTDDRVRRCQAVLDEWREINAWGCGPAVMNPADPADDAILLQDRQTEGFRRWRRDGEVFLRFFRGGRASNYLPVCRWVEPEYVRQPPGGGTDTVWGVRADPADAERLVSYYVTDADATEYEEVPAWQIVHLKANADAAIRRGVPDFMPLHDDLERVRKLLRNMGEVAAILAAIAYIRQHAPNVSQTQIDTMIEAGRDYSLPRVPYEGGGRSRNVPIQTAEPGQIIDVSNGLNYTAAPMNAGVSGFVAVEQAILRAAGARWGMPEFFTGDASNNNLASIMISGSPFVRATKARQAEYAGFQRAIAGKVLAFACQAGRLSEADVRAVEVKVTAPAVEIADKTGDTQRRQILNAAGVLSPQTWAAEEGYDAAQEFANIQDFKDQFPDAGGGGPLGGLMGGDDPFGGGGAGDGGPTPVDYGGSLTEAVLYEDGKTGVFKDRAGRRYRLADGVRVPLGEPGESGKEPAAQTNNKGGAAGGGKAVHDRLSGIKASPGSVVAAPEHEAADIVSNYLAESLGGHTEEQATGPGQKDKKPFDVRVKKRGRGYHDIEVKSLLKGNKQGITVHEDALLRKVNHGAANPDNTFHTVVSDHRDRYSGGQYADNYSGHQLYYKRGGGKFTLAEMYPVKDEAELRRLLATPDDRLPELARGQLPPPPPIDELQAAAAKAAEGRKARDKRRKEANRDKLREQARIRSQKAKELRALTAGAGQ